MNNLYTYYIFDTSKFIGYKSIIEKNFIKSFQKIKYEGFDIILLSKEVIKFKIQNQLLRKLKIKYINNDIIDIIESKIFELISKSKKYIPECDNIFLSSSGSSGYRYNDGQIKELRERSKYQERFNNQKIKNRLKYK